MRLFKRKDRRTRAGGVIGPDESELAHWNTSEEERDDADPEDLAGAAEADEGGSEDDDARGEPAHGPWDVDEAPSEEGLIDLGAVRIPKRPGLQVRMELDKKTRRIVAVNLALEGSALQVQPFAAPRSEGLWEELRAEIAESIKKQGGSADERTGAFGRELLARLPVRMPDGRSGTRPARFLGVDGTRWFLRGVLTGKATVDAQAAEVMEDIFAGIVVDRGSEPRPPRELLSLHLPGQSAQPQAPAQEERLTIRLPKRGPEITEVR